MPNKIVYLAVMFTLAYWLGSVVGCSSSNQIENNNYKLLEEDRPMFETKPNMTDPGATAPPVSIEESTASLNGLDRSDWEHVAVGPAQGDILRSPHYFDDCPVYTKRPVSDEPLGNVENAGWDKANTMDFLTQPVKFAYDIALFPVRLATDPPRHWQVRVP